MAFFLGFGIMCVSKKPDDKGGDSKIKRVLWTTTVWGSEVAPRLVLSLSKGLNFRTVEGPIVLTKIISLCEDFIFMKLLLTSNGLSNQSISDALFDLVGKKPEETIVTFIPTAANYSNNDKGWLVNDLQNIYKQGFKKFTITDIAALTLEECLVNMKEADVLFFGGGSVDYLMTKIEMKSLQDYFPELLQTKVWAGISAGAMVTASTLALSSVDLEMYYDEPEAYQIETHKKGLGFVDFYIRPHLGSLSFPDVTIEYVQPIAEKISKQVYLLDDNSAVKVDGDSVEVVSEGKYHIFNKQSNN